MASITLKNVPEDLLNRLRALACGERRSLNQQILHLLDAAVSQGADLGTAKAEAARQAEAWKKLAGRWKSKQSSEDEIAEIYASRTQGRSVEL